MPKLGTPLFTLVAPVGWPMAALECNTRMGRTEAHNLVDSAMNAAEDQDIVEHVDVIFRGGRLYVILTFHISTQDSEEKRIAALGVVEVVVRETREYMAKRVAAMAAHPARRKRVRSR